MARVWAYMLGAVRLRVTGAMPERLLNLCLEAGIPLWDVRHDGDALYASMTVRDVFRMRPLARKARCRVRIVGRGGFPFAWRRLRRRRMLLVAAVLVLVGLEAFGSFVWFFEVRGHEALSEAEILQTAAEAGLRSGAWRPALDRDAIARHMILREPAIAWVGIEFIGTKAIITVVESKLPPEEAPSGPGDLVAERAGVVEQVLVLRGEAVVGEGDTVLPGQVLIRGLIAAPGPVEQFPPPGAEPPADQFRPVRARGQVLARTWYEGYIEVPLVERIPTRTGRWAQQRLLFLAGREVLVGGVRRVPFARYDTERAERPLPPWAGAGAAFRLITVTFHEIEDVEHRRTPQQALQEARRRLQDRLLADLDVNARILSVQVEDSRVAESFASMRMVIEVLEDITRFIPNDLPSPEPNDTE